MGAKNHAYERRLQLKHFFEDRDTGKTRRTWCEMQVAMPEKTSEGWVNLVNGSCIGHKFIARFEDVEVSSLRLDINKSLAEPLIQEFSVYRIVEDD